MTPTFTKHTNHCYTVRNRIGFKRAMYDYFKAGKPGHVTKSDVTRMVQNSPMNYPSKIVIVDNSFVNGRVLIEVIE